VPISGLKTSNRIGFYPLAITALLICIPTAFGQNRQLDTNRYLPLAKVKPGMKGFGKTVFAGTKIQRFNAEVIDVLANIDPRRPTYKFILAKLSGRNLERTGLIQGMSGSPVYLTDPDDGKAKLAGAVAFGWSFAKPGPPVCILQPIEQMLPLEKQADKTPTDGGTAALSLATRFVQNLCHVDAEALRDLANNRFSIIRLPDQRAAFTRDGSRPSEPPDLAFTSLATPVMVSGVNSRLLAALRRTFAAYPLNFVAGGSASARTDAHIELQPGASLASPLVSGDLALDAVGTATEVLEGKVWAFGHPFFSEGPTRLPMATGIIHTVVANQISSFKLGSAVQPVGTLTVDQGAGVFGRQGRIPQPISLSFTVQDEAGEKRYDYKIVDHHDLSPTLALICLASSVLADRQLPPKHTLRYSGDMTFEQFGTVRIDNVTSGRDILPLLTDLILPAAFLMDNPFGRAKLTALAAEVKIEPADTTAVLQHVQPLRTRIAPGQTLKMLATIRPYRQPPQRLPLAIRIPSELPDGTYNLLIGDLDAHLRAEQAEKPYIYQPLDLPGVFRAIREVNRAQQNRIYIRLQTDRQGLAYKNVGMPDMPPSKLAILGNDRQAYVTPFKQSVVKVQECPYVLKGLQRLKIRVDRKAPKIQ